MWYHTHTSLFDQQNEFFFKNFFEDISPFHGATDTPVLDFCPGFQSQGGSLVCFLACVILRFTSGATPADCIEVSLAAKPFGSTYLQMCLQTLVKVRIKPTTQNEFLYLLYIHHLFTSLKN